MVRTFFPVTEYIDIPKEDDEPLCRDTFSKSEHPDVSLISHCLPNPITNPYWFHFKDDDSHFIIYGDAKLDVGLYEVSSNFDSDKFNESLKQGSSSLLDAILA